jgi:hypothetical protein
MHLHSSSDGFGVSGEELAGGVTAGGERALPVLVAVFVVVTFAA